MATFRGSCLCGEVAFEVDGPFDHCIPPFRAALFDGRERCRS